MTNREKYKDELIEMLIDDNNYVERFKNFFNNTIKPCYNTPEWKFLSGETVAILTAIWLGDDCSETEIDWTKVAMDTPILVRVNEYEEWEKRYFAEFKDGKVFAWNGGCTSWNADSQCYWKYAKLAEEE